MRSIWPSLGRPMLPPRIHIHRFLLRPRNFRSNLLSFRHSRLSRGRNWCFTPLWGFPKRPSVFRHFSPLDSNRIVWTACSERFKSGQPLPQCWILLSFPACGAAGTELRESMAIRFSQVFVLQGGEFRTLPRLRTSPDHEKQVAWVTLQSGWGKRYQSQQQQQKSGKRGCSSCALAQGTALSSRGTMARPVPPAGTLQAVLFDVDGTLTNSDPLHYECFRDMLCQEGYRGGEPITEDFFVEHMSGRFNSDIGQFLFPDWDEPKQTKWMDDKEALFRKRAGDQLEGTAGLAELAKWVEKKKLRRAAVTNAPRANAEQMIGAVGLADFFEYLVVGSECDRGKPFPDPYLKAIRLLGVPAEATVAFEDSGSGVKSAVAAQVAVVGIVSGNPESDLLKAGATFAVKDFFDPALWKALGEPKPT